MKNIAIAILLIASVGFGGLYFYQKQQTSVAQSTNTSLRQQITELEAEINQQQEKAIKLGDRLADTYSQATVKTAEASRLEQALAEESRALTNALTSAPAPAKPDTNSANPFAGMFKSPEMKDMIKAQQKLILGPMMEKNYAAFFAGLQLPPEQAASLKDLILKRSLIDAGAGVSLMSADADKRSEIMQQTKADKDTINDQIKQILGDDGYAQFKTYEKSMPERMSLNMFKDQLGAGANAMSQDQESQLLQALGQERQGFKFTTDFGDQSKLDGDVFSNFTEDKINVYSQELGQLAQRYLARAQEILSPDQFDSYKKFVTGQQAMQTASLKMAAKMFAPAAK